MKTTAEMIEVMQAYERGEAIEIKSFNGNGWIPCERLCWNWDVNANILSEWWRGGGSSR